MATASPAATSQADATIEALPLDAMGRVSPHPWWGDTRDVTLQQIMLHVTVETDWHAGHADIVRELIDGEVGLPESSESTDGDDEAWYQDYWSRLKASAKEAVWAEAVESVRVHLGA